MLDRDGEQALRQSAGKEGRVQPGANLPLGPRGETVHSNHGCHAEDANIWWYAGWALARVCDSESGDYLTIQ